MLRTGVCVFENAKKQNWCTTFTHYYNRIPTPSYSIYSHPWIPSAIYSISLDLHACTFVDLLAVMSLLKWASHYRKQLFFASTPATLKLISQIESKRKAICFSNEKSCQNVKQYADTHTAALNWSNRDAIQTLQHSAGVLRNENGAVECIAKMLCLTLFLATCERPVHAQFASCSTYVHRLHNDVYYSPVILFTFSLLFLFLF